MKSAYLGTSRRINEALRAADAGLAVNPSGAPIYAARASAEISLARDIPTRSEGLRKAGMPEE